MDTFANDKTCNHKQPSNIQWDVTSFYPRQGTNTDIPQGRCTAVQLKAGGDVDHWASNQTAYAIVRCGATTQPESDNSTDSTTAASCAPTQRPLPASRHTGRWEYWPPSSSWQRWLEGSEREWDGVFGVWVRKLVM